MRLVKIGEYWINPEQVRYIKESEGYIKITMGSEYLSLEGFKLEEVLRRLAGIRQSVSEDIEG